MRTRVVTLLIVLVWSAAHADVDRDVARRAFDVLERNCSSDGGALWGVSLCGRVILVEKSSRNAVANDGWSGRLPDEIGIANTAFDWKGARWSMVMWPLPADAGARDRLLIHERFHAIQRDVGLPMASPANGHLDSLDGRYLMRLEMRALRAAVLALRDGRSFRPALRDAVAFRHARQAEFPSAAAGESSLELNEGLAEYTAVRLFTADRKAKLDRVAVALAEGENEAGFVRSFAYATGPAWGVVADEFSNGWRSTVARRGSIDGVLPFSSRERAVEKRARRYGGPDLLTEERKRDKERRERLRSYAHRFIEGRVLKIPLQNIQMQFDPHDVHPFDTLGTVYEKITVSDVWGKIVVDRGALISGDFSTLTVVAPSGSTVFSDSWALTLAPGWRVAPGRRDGDFVVERAPQ